jgi:[CysO sulfur-carrier protein]-S-L-cysteine hydrolase
LIDLSDEHRRQIIAHCRAALPNEGCGMLAMDGDRVVKVYPTGNEEASPTRYTIPPQEHFDALSDAEANGWRLGGVFHSHPSGPARMSATDLAKATEPDWVHVVVGLNGPEPTLSAWIDGEYVPI